jgi:hypothetical protein
MHLLSVPQPAILFGRSVFVPQVFEGGALYDPAVLSITDEVMLGSVASAISNIAALSLATGFPTLASIPHSVINGYKNVLAVSLATDYDFPLSAKVWYESEQWWERWWVGCFGDVQYLMRTCHL